MADFGYAVNLKGGGTCEIDLDKIERVSFGLGMHDAVTLHFGPGSDYTIDAGPEAWRFRQFWDRRWRSALEKVGEGSLVSEVAL
jgi:hypothetical protein